MRAILLTAVLLTATLATVAPAQRPGNDQVRALLQTQPDLTAQLRQRIATSGLSAEQIRSRLIASGYAGNLLDAYLTADGAGIEGAEPVSRVLEAVRALGLATVGEFDPLATDSVPGEPGLLRRDLPQPDTGAKRLRVFGLDVFRRVSTQFQPPTTGPVDPSYRLGPGDVLVLILTGDVEVAHTLEVTREGFVVIPQVGQVYVGSLTLGQLETALYPRLGRVYSGVRRTSASISSPIVANSRSSRREIPSVPSATGLLSPSATAA